MARTLLGFGERLTQRMDALHRSDGDLENLSRREFAFWFQAQQLPKRARPLRFPSERASKRASSKTAKVSHNIVTHLSKRDIANWRNDMRPRKWQSVVMLAALLDLNERAADEWLRVTQHPPLAELRQQARAPEDKQLLARWAVNFTPPFQAIAFTKNFVGRVNEIKQLERALVRGETVTLTSVRGMGGVGKTTLAAYLAERLRAQFPDGVLWAELDRSDSMSILASFANAYQREVSQLRDVATRGAFVRDLLKDKRVLIILDDARTSEQVWDLLPAPSSPASVLITTRLELAVSDEAFRVQLRVFHKRGDEALALFKKSLGKQAGRQRGRLEEIARLVGHLPLALAIAGAHMASVKEQTTLAFAVEQFLQRVRDENKRLGALDREAMSVRAALAISYDALAEELKTFFVALGAFAGGDFDARAASFIAQISEAQANAYLNALEKLSLVQTIRAGRFALHELVRDFAREKSAGTNFDARMCEYYFQFVAPHNDLHAYGAVTQEDSNIQAALRVARQLQEAALLTRGALACADYLLAQGHFDFLDEIAGAALALLPSDEKFARMRLHLKRAELARSAGRYTQARTHLEQGLPFVYQLEESLPIAEYLSNLGVLTYLDGDTARAQTYHRQALAMALEHNHTRILAGIYNNLAQMEQVRGDFDAAVAYLDLASAHASESWQIAALSNLVHRGRIATARGEFETARNYFSQVLEEGEQSGVNMRRVGAYDGLARLALAEQDWAAAEKFFEELKRVGMEIQHQSAIAVAHSGLGETYWRGGDRTHGENELQRALELVQLTDDATRIATVRLAHLRFQVAQARWNDARAAAESLLFSKINYAEARAELYFCLAQIYRAQGDAARAEQYARDALALYEKMKHHCTKQVREWLIVSAPGL